MRQVVITGSGGVDLLKVQEKLDPQNVGKVMIKP